MTGKDIVHTVAYKPESKSTDEYVVFVNPEEYNKWKEGVTSIALALIVDKFAIYSSGQGKQGKFGEISKQDLSIVFGTEVIEDAVKILLEKGTLQKGEALSSKYSNKNDSRGGSQMDLRGSGGGLRG
ncbi:hypothetical protein BOTBODRAFT_37545 [Botryobasidium botryosum FD-172 SS1]|uniref:Ribosome maturation protein SDO1/SBDS N-terminal domain-containing protein n=1 Tax=Botryobasidium botryosum (strain FD-172 SS1) TaxID=930990 RepID=A0A067MBA2_BOTB1|nr:hypothetical protein BOTBODRAFT_37545 [Botryobasidium botryosum FD-172 SS1]